MLPSLTQLSLLALVAGPVVTAQADALEFHVPDSLVYPKLSAAELDAYPAKPTAAPHLIKKASDLEPRKEYPKYHGDIVYTSITSAILACATDFPRIYYGPEQDHGDIVYTATTYPAGCPTPAAQLIKKSPSSDDNDNDNDNDNDSDSDDDDDDVEVHESEMVVEPSGKLENEPVTAARDNAADLPVSNNAHVILPRGTGENPDIAPYDNEITDDSIAVSKQMSEWFTKVLPHEKDQWAGQDGWSGKDGKGALYELLEQKHQQGRQRRHARAFKRAEALDDSEEAGHEMAMQ